MALAGLVYLTRPRRTQNRLLALTLFFEAAVAFFFGLTALADAPRLAAAADLTNWTVFIPLLTFYLLFLATLDSPLGAPFRARAGQAGLAVALVGLLALRLAVPGWFLAELRPGTLQVWEPIPGPGAQGLVVLGMVVAVYGLAVTLSAWRRAAPGSAAREQARVLVLAFGIRDATWLMGAPLDNFGFQDTALVAIARTIVLPLLALYMALLAYGILRHQLFDIDLRVKRTVRHGTVAAVFVAVFFAASEGAQLVLADALGPIVGLAAAAALVFALVPLQRAADRLADRALPGVRDTAEYRTVRKREVYQAAVESALQDGVITEKERDVLATLAEKLALGPVEARAVERDVLARARGASA